MFPWVSMLPVYATPLDAVRTKEIRVVKTLLCTANF